MIEIYIYIFLNAASTLFLCDLVIISSCSLMCRNLFMNKPFLYICNSFVNVLLMIELPLNCPFINASLMRKQSSALPSYYITETMEVAMTQS